MIKLSFNFDLFKNHHSSLCTILYNTYVTSLLSLDCITINGKTATKIELVLFYVSNNTTKHYILVNTSSLSNNLRP